MRLLAAAVTLPLSLALALGTAPASAAPAVRAQTRYVALGDSYSAGVAAGAYDPSSGDCHRSTRAYGTLWTAGHRPSSFLFTACNGATTKDVLRDQLPEVRSDTTLATITVGGNDLGFTKAIVSCLQPLTTESLCDQAMAESEQKLRDELPGKLEQTYQAIGTAAPGAKVVVAGYPHLLEHGSVLCTVGTPARRDRFNALTDRLDELIRAQATKQGFEFADVRGSFAGHGICAGGSQEWIARIVVPAYWESFHPTTVGQAQGYLPPVSAAIAG
ncbi:SGNH/GDSL hydrolase family protein [Kitasatospora sp. GP82]|uniref:SGNH/GDSL hydrolase family protein n=1 Tax=Kitasatospora sp. GP82 TaxID=3035089 RepID=UPI002475C428|nr:SGNH/GDSL hydrolase family protein [Kitasatospora sp. GP82]MDH6129647.1 lysophospholipase L1-like esterase [Kitasatospora sp. GP82]